MTSHLWLGIKLCMTVDRIEGDYAVVEWSSGETTAVSRHLFPSSLYEGQSLTLHLRKKEGGEAQAVSSHPAMLSAYTGLIELPGQMSLPHGESFRIRLEPMESTFVLSSTKKTTTLPGPGWRWRASRR
jgi:hypothetical protein